VGGGWLRLDWAGGGVMGGQRAKAAGHTTDPDRADQSDRSGVVAIDLDDLLDRDAAAVGTEARERAVREQGRRDRAALRELHAAQQAVAEAIRQAEAKATSLLGLFGAALAAALVLLTRTSGIHVFAVVVLTATTAPLLGSVVALLSVLRARLDGEHGLFRWALYQHNPDALIDHLTLAPHRRAEVQARRLVELSALALVKFRRVNLAVALLLASLPLLALAALTA
jgi:hypothetical protein